MCSSDLAGRDVEALHLAHLHHAVVVDVHVQLGGPKGPATKAVDTAVDRLIYYAGWADKYEQVLGNVNPVAQPYFNFTVTEPMGIVGVLLRSAGT